MLSGQRNQPLAEGFSNLPSAEAGSHESSPSRGFPEIMHIIRPDRSVEFNAHGALPAVENVTGSQIILPTILARGGRLRRELRGALADR
jgi:hypothetical protein